MTTLKLATSKMYDVFEQDAKSEAFFFVMRSPLATISRLYDLHRDAEARAFRETEVDGGICTLHVGRIHDRKTKVIVQRAVGVLNPNRVVENVPASI